MTQFLKPILDPQNGTARESMTMHPRNKHTRGPSRETTSAKRLSSLRNFTPGAPPPSLTFDLAAECQTAEHSQKASTTNHPPRHVGPGRPVRAPGDR
eukprot:5331283-Pyramimonas_sp.AAC.1